jgi:NADPH2:quinone reductase
MRAWQLHEFGSLDHLTLDEVLVPEPGPGEVLLHVAYAALNPADHYMALGQYPRPCTPPFALGRDASGVVAMPVPGGRFAQGDRVVLLASDLGVGRTGTLAEYVCVPEEQLAPLPEGWSMQEGAAAPLVFLTAWKALVEQGELAPGQTVLINGASGGVGSAAVMLAHSIGAKVVALSRGTAKQAALNALGANVIVDAAAPDWDAAVKRALNGGRIDLVVDNLGGTYFEKSLSLLSYNGRMVVIGLLAGLTPRVQLGLMIHKCLRIQGASVSAYVAGGAEVAWAGILAALARTGQRPLVDSVHGLAAVKSGFARLGEGPLGKVVIGIGDSLD